MKVVVFGSSGFLGSHVVDELFNQGHKVSLFDSSVSSSFTNFENQTVGSILDPDLVQQAVSGHDIVYNFAAIADLGEAQKNPRQTAEVNIIGLLNILDACVTSNVSHFVQASSVYVHSRLGGFYKSSKLAAESFIEEFFEEYGLPYTILRYGSLYGPRAPETNGIQKIIQRAVSDGRLEYAGSPESMREYIHVADAAKSTVKILAPEFIGKNVVLTGVEPIKVKDLLRMVGEILNLDSSEILFRAEVGDGHYISTPYSYNPRLGIKYLPETHIDLGQGLIEVINLVYQQNNFS